MHPSTQQALAQLDSAAMLDFFQALVRTPSVYIPDQPGANEQAAARLIFQLLEQWGWQPIWEEAAPGRPNIVAELPGALGADGPLLLFEGHTDVVTPGDLAAWQFDPFGGTIVERETPQGSQRRLYGRGAADMKSGVAAMLFAARALQLAGAPFRGRVRLLIPVDEEGLMIGIKALVARGHADSACGAIICEPEEREVCIAQKGSLRLRLISYGRIAHGAMPTEGINALSGMTRLLGAVLDLEAELQAKLGAHPLLGDLYISPTVIRAPLSGDTSQINCLPDQCDAYLDIRSIPSISHAALIARIRQLIERISALPAGYRFELEVIDDRPSTETPSDHPLVLAVLAAHRQVYGSPARFGGVPGSTDGTILARDRQIPVVVYGPGNKRIPHQPNEFVDLDEVVRAAQVYIVAALDMLRNTA